MICYRCAERDGLKDEYSDSDLGSFPLNEHDSCCQLCGKQGSLREVDTGLIQERNVLQKSW